MDNTSVTLRAWRTGAGRTVADVARELDVSRQAYSRYETGSRVPGYAILNKIVVMTDGMVTANSWLNPEASNVVARADGADLDLIVKSRVEARLSAVRKLIDELMDKETAHVVLERLESV